MLFVFVPGIPAPQGSKRHVGRGIMIESSKKVAPWRSVVALTVGEIVDAPLDGPIAVRLDFVMPRPKSTPKTRATPPAVKKPDIDKLVRAILDAITAVAWHDDSQVVSVAATKRIAELDERPGVLIRVEPCGPVSVDLSAEADAA